MTINIVALPVLRSCDYRHLCSPHRRAGCAPQIVIKGTETIPGDASVAMFGAVAPVTFVYCVCGILPFIRAVL